DGGAGDRGAGRGGGRHGGALLRLEHLAALLAAHRLVDPVRGDSQEAVAVRAFRLDNLAHRFTFRRSADGRAPARPPEACNSPPSTLLYFNRFHEGNEKQRANGSRRPGRAVVPAADCGGALGRGGRAPCPTAARWTAASQASGTPSGGGRAS